MRLRRPVEIAERPGEAVEVVLGAVVVPVNGAHRAACATHLGHPAIDFLDRLRDLRAPPLVGRRGELRLELGAREPQRLERAHLLRIAHAGLPCVLRALALELFHPFLNSCIRVDQSFASITHESLAVQMNECLVTL